MTYRENVKVSTYEPFGGNQTAHDKPLFSVNKKEDQQLNDN